VADTIIGPLILMRSTASKNWCTNARSPIYR